ncbi:hypothetical protein ACXWTF_10305 [Thiomicrolovo sp. ZZH C-3]
MRWIVLALGVMTAAFLAAGRMEGHPNAPVDGKFSIPSVPEMAVQPAPMMKKAPEKAVMTGLPHDTPLLTEEERAYNRLVAAERRIERQRARVVYLKARREWRQALNAARRSGDEAALRRIEVQEPVRPDNGMGE